MTRRSPKFGTRWTIETEEGDVLARFASEEMALSAFFSHKRLNAMGAKFKEGHDTYILEYRLKCNGEEVIWH